MVSCLRIKELGEFGLIERLTQAAASRDDVVVGIGDDAAVLRVTPGSLLVASSDMLVEGVHFLKDRIPARALGHKLLAISLSDMAAMGATPKFALVSLALPQDTEVEFIQNVYDGLHCLADRFGVSLVGGDTVSASQLVLDLTVLGEVVPDNYRLRSGARSGDLIIVTGDLGSSAAGLAWELASPDPDRASAANLREQSIRSHYWPEPQVAVARAWCGQGLLTALNDISDGLASEVNEICTASKAGAVLYADQIPISPCASEAATLLDKDIWELCLNGGEDYQLLATLPGDQLSVATRTAAELGVKVSVIGEIKPEAEGIMLVKGGRTATLSKAGYDHFA